MADRRERGKNGRTPKESPAAYQERQEKLLFATGLCEHAACRELLDLDACPDFDGVVATLHRVLHGWKKETGPDKDKRLALKVAAAAVLLKSHHLM